MWTSFFVLLLIGNRFFLRSVPKKMSIHRMASNVVRIQPLRNRLAKKSAIQQFGINQFEGWLSAASRWNIIASQLSFVLPKACPPAVRCHSSSKRDIKVFVIFILRLHHIMAAHCFKGNQKFISHLLVHAVPTPVTYGSGDREDILIFGERK